MGIVFSFNPAPRFGKIRCLRENHRDVCVAIQNPPLGGQLVGIFFLKAEKKKKRFRSNSGEKIGAGPIPGVFLAGYVRA